MLIIREHQFDALFEARLPEIARDLADYLRRACPDSVAQLDDTLLLERVAAGVWRARRWGFESMFSLAAFVSLMFEVAPDFDAHPRLSSWLDAGSPDERDARLESIADVLTEEEWEHLAASGNQASWQESH